MTALIVIVFMNSARKNSAKRMRGVLGVEPADQLLLGLDEVERRRFSSAVAAIRKMTNGTNAGGDEVPVGEAVLDVDDAAGATACPRSAARRRG